MCRRSRTARGPRRRRTLTGRGSPPYNEAPFRRPPKGGRRRWTRHFDLLTLALLPGVAAADGRASSRAAAPAGRRPRRSPTSTPTCCRAPRRGALRSGRAAPARRGGAAPRAAALGVAHRRPRRAATTRACCAGSTTRRPSSTCAGRSRRTRARAAWPSWARARRTAGRAAPSPAPWPATWPRRAPPSSPAWPAASTPRPTRARSTAGGRTVAVLGSGLDRLYPPENAGLAAAIAERGAVVSEFPLGTAAAARALPAAQPRHRGLGRGGGGGGGRRDAAARSITARAARWTRGARSWRCPAIPASRRRAGTNQLIRDGAGAGARRRRRGRRSSGSTLAGRAAAAGGRRCPAAPCGATRPSSLEELQRAQRP